MENSKNIRTSLRVSWQLGKFAIAAILITLPIRIFLAQPFIVSGDSMAPTLSENNYLVIDKLSYRMHPPQRGDVIIMRYPLDPNIYFVKRVIGLPGETVGIENGAVTILMPTGSSTKLIEPYAVNTMSTSSNSVTTLDKDEFFVMGDNRDHSSDSREWGPLQSRFIVGRAFMRLLPVNELELLPGEYIFAKK